MNRLPLCLVAGLSLAAIGSSIHLHAQDFQTIAPKQPEKQGGGKVINEDESKPFAGKGGEVLVSELKGVRLVAHAKEVKTEDYHGTPGVDVGDVTLAQNPDGAGGLVLVDILKREVRRARLGDGFFDGGIDGRIVAALEAGKLQSHQVGMARRKLRRPHFVIRAGGVAILPYVADIQRMRDQAGADLVAEQPFQKVFIQR